MKIFRLLLFIFMVILPGCNSTVTPGRAQVQIGLPALEQNALIYIAIDQGYFEQNGLAVTLQHFDTGVASLQAMRDGGMELAVAAEFPIVRALMDKEPVALLASIDRFENDYIVARKDRGIAQVSDLKGKRVGVTSQTINEFFLARFLELNSLQPGDLTQVDLRPAEFIVAITSGRVDALIAWQPYIYEIEQKQKDIILWPAQSSQPVYGLLVARPDWLAENHQAAHAVLRSLLQAEEFLAHDPETAQKIVQRQLEYDAAYVDRIWQDHLFSVTLDNSLIVAMNDEARWLIRAGLSGQNRAPEFYDAIFLDALLALKPEAVSIQ